MENGAKARLAVRGQEGIVYMAEITRRARARQGSSRRPVTVGRAYRARATCGRQRQPAQCACMVVCTQRSSRHVQARDLALVGDDCELTSTLGTDGPSGQGDGSDPE
jgi:hypothetical protein